MARNYFRDLNGFKDMSKDTTDIISKITDDDQDREAYYRACIAEFQQLGYQEQYLEQLGDELVPVTGVESLIERKKT